MPVCYAVENEKCVPHEEYPGVPVVEVDEWIPSPEKDGTLTRKRWRTLKDVAMDLNAGLKTVGIDMDDHGMYPWSINGADTDTIPPHKWIACFAVTGGSEGHYIHVEALLGEHRMPLFLGKTFQGMDHALAIASACAKLLAV